MEGFSFRGGSRFNGGEKLSRNELSRLFCKVIQAIKYLRWSLKIVLRSKIPGLSCVPCFTVHAKHCRRRRRRRRHEVKHFLDRV